MRAHYDVVIIGGGIFGVYSACYLDGKGLRVLLIEKEDKLMTKASIVNQARLHAGYHYPRSIATALMSHENKKRFETDHRDFINFAFNKYYAIDRYASFTNPSQFQRFCDHIGIMCKLQESHDIIDLNRIEALFLTQEFTFDPILIAQFYRAKMEQTRQVTIAFSSTVTEAVAVGDRWEITFQNHANQKKESCTASQVINATYAGSNTINQLFGVQPIDLMHEISEMVFVSAENFPMLGLTVMDGQFGSIMPYGLSGLWSLSSVAYTHHKVSYEAVPNFDCMEKHLQCRPNFLNNCNYCSEKPRSNQHKMIRQIKHYFRPHIEFNYFKSMFAVKSKLRANYIDDGRPTEISILKDSPRYYCIFAGKINSIYEIEKVFKFS